MNHAIVYVNLHETLSCNKGFELTHFYVWFKSCKSMMFSGFTEEMADFNLEDMRKQLKFGIKRRITCHKYQYAKSDFKTQH